MPDRQKSYPARGKIPKDPQARMEKLRKELASLEARQKELAGYQTLADDWISKEPCLMKGLCERAKKLRLSLGLTQGELGLLMKIAPGEIGRMEQGECRMSLKVMARLCAIGKVSMDWLLGIDFPRFSGDV